MRRRETAACPIVGEWDGSGTTSAAVGVDRPAGDSVAVPTGSNLGFRWEGFSLEDLRLEHELQTVAGGGARRCRDFFACSRHRRDTVPAALLATGTRVAREAPAVLFLKGIGVACSFRRLSAHFGAARVSKQEFETRRPPSFPVFGSHLGGRAGCPNATQPEPVTVSTFLHKAPHRELASRLWALAQISQSSGCAASATFAAI